MALNLGGGAGSYTPAIKWLAQTSSWSIREENGDRTIQLNEFVADMENLTTGWCCFKQGMAPQWVMDKSLSEPAARPSDEKDPQGQPVWKRGFKVDLFSPNTFGGDGVREFATNATGACMGMDALHTAYEAQKGQHPGQLPVVKYTGPMPTKVGKGSTNIPQMAILKFVPRPAALGTGGSVSPQQQPALATAAYQQTTAAYQKPVQQPQPASVSEF